MKNDKPWGAALGAGGLAFTLFIGGSVNVFIQFILKLTPYGNEAFTSVSRFLPPLGAGIWLMLPLACWGYLKGFGETLRFFSIFWASADYFRVRQGFLYWAVLALVCFASKAVLNFIGS